MDSEVLEGFLCPICYTDLKTALNLNAHFQKQHQDDQKLFKSVKDVFEKAKKKIRSSEQTFSFAPGDSETQTLQPRRTVGYPPSQAQSIDTVSWRSHTDRFKGIRDLRNERYAAQTNTLLIRLEKLLKQLPTDPIRRKAYEQEVVPWIDDKSVTLCPGCAKSFNILKRKHHCRVCGAVMCKNCTFLLSLDVARKMVGVTSEPSSAKSVPCSPATVSRLQPVQAVQSVLSLDGSTDSEFLLCEHCHQLLHAREIARQNRSERPIIAQFYDRMRAAHEACDSLVTEFHNIYSSLSAGETKYTLMHAQELRVELLRLAETVDSTSKKILVLGQNSDPPPTGSRLKLQQAVRNAAALYLKQKVISLPSLPSEEELLEYQERRRLEMERKIEEERQKLEEETMVDHDIRVRDVVNHRTPEMPQRSNNGMMTMEAGWTPTIKPAIISDDPVLQQIGILHGFIEQAEKAGKLDECAALRQNLMDLEQLLDEREAVGRLNT